MQLLDHPVDLVADQVRHLRADTTSPDEPRIGPFGPTTLHGLMESRVLDLWVHEQDIREAIGRPDLEIEIP